MSANDNRKPYDDATQQWQIKVLNDRWGIDSKETSRLNAFKAENIDEYRESLKKGRGKQRG